MEQLKYKIILCCLFLCNLVIHAKEQVLEQLQEAIKASSQYDAAKKKQLNAFYIKAVNAKTTNSQYKAYIQLFEAYQSYKYDSASVYADKALAVAKRLRNPNYQVEATCAKVFCLLSAGLYKEAFDEVNLVDISLVTTPYYKYKYYSVKSRLFSDMADYSRTEPYSSQYVKESRALTDTLKKYTGYQTSEYYYVEGMQLMKERKCKESEQAFQHVLSDPKISHHKRAICLSCMGWLCQLRGDEKGALRYLAESAIYDIKTATKETMALREVGAILYSQGEVNTAIEYVQKALDDANFYNARQRKIEIGNVLPVIQQSRTNDLETQRNMMILCSIMVCIVLIVLTVSTLLIKKQIKKVRAAYKTIGERNQKLEEANKKLEEANALLSESNKIKTVYIGKSFYTSAEYIEKIEKLYKSIERKLRARQYEDLLRSLSETTLAKERENMYDDFDVTFLHLYPDFIEKYNALFEEKDRKEPNEQKHLNKEMRIFALIRLGVNDSERIAHFLGYSVNTVNTYKTRVKNKSIVSNDEFEQKIMEI